MRYVIDIRGTLMALWFMLVLSLTTTSTQQEFSKQNHSPVQIVALSDAVFEDGHSSADLSTECRAGHITDEAIVPDLVDGRTCLSMRFSHYAPPADSQRIFARCLGLSNQPRAPPAFI